MNWVRRILHKKGREASITSEKYRVTSGEKPEAKNLEVT